MDFFKNDDLLKKNKDSDKQPRSLWSRIFKNQEGQFYSEVITKGFVWVLMFIISVVALVIVFTKGNSDNSEVIVVSKQDKSYMTDKDQSNIADNSQNSNDENKIYNNDDSEPRENYNESSTDISKLNNKESRTNYNNHNKLKSKKSSAKPKSYVKSESSKKLESLIIESNLQPKSKEKTIKQIYQQKVLPKARPKKQSNTSNEVKPLKKVYNKKLTNTNLTKVWLVNIFSYGNPNSSRLKWKEVKAMHSELFMGKRAYIVKVILPNKGTFYRISIAKYDSIKGLGFRSSVAAKDYCATLKKNNLNCFISKTDIKSIKQSEGL